MRRKIPQILIFVGAALIVTACAIMIYNKVDDNLAGRRAQQLLDQMMDQMLEEGFYLPEYDGLAEHDGANAAQRPASTQRPPGQENQSQEDPGGGQPQEENEEDGAETETAVKATGNGTAGSSKQQSPGYNTLGVLQIPAINLKLPIIEGWTDARGNIAPCSIAGTATPKPRRLIIAGHNLKSHFKSLIDLNIGDEVMFTTKDGVTHLYSVVEVGQCHRDNPEEVSAGSGWDMTLVTCKTIRTMRTLIRCAEIPKEVPEEIPEETPEETPEEAPGGMQEENAVEPQ